MTNREVMINLLLDGLDKELERFVSDDGGASEEAMIYYNINCPYFDGDSRCHCSHTISPPGKCVRLAKRNGWTAKKMCNTAKREESEMASLFVCFFFRQTIHIR